MLPSKLHFPQGVATLTWDLY